MFGSDILEVAIGLVMVYLVLSLLCTTVTDWITRIFALRTKTLQDGIYELINNDKNLNAKILHNPFLRGLSPKDAKINWWDSWHLWKWYPFKKTNYGPSEIPPDTFAQIILDTVMNAEKKSGSGYAAIISASSSEQDKNDAQGRSMALLKASRVTVQNLEQNIKTLDIKNDNKVVLQAFLAAAKTKAANWDGVVKEFRASLAKWFDDSQQRVTGWYKRKTQVIVLCLALALCFGMNVDTVGIANNFYSNPELRSVVVAAAESTANESVSNNSTLPTYPVISDNISLINLNLGWNTENNPNQTPDTGWGWVAKIVGILITVFALSLGAPFWFDLLKKLLSLRTAGKTPKKTEEATSDSG